MEIKVYGTGCAKCERLYDAVERVLQAEGILADLHKVESLDEILAAGIMITPGLLIDGELKAVGKVPRDKKLVEWIRAAASR